MSTPTFLPQRLVRAAPGQHVAHLFSSEQGRTATVSSYALEGLHSGQGVIVVMSEPRAGPVRRELESRGIPVAELQASGDLVFEDATGILSKLRSGDRLDSDAFEQWGQSLIDLTRRVRRTREVRVYEELVETLQNEGRTRLAAWLEELWADLIRTRGAALLCGYTSVTSDGSRFPEELAGLHSRVYQELSSRERLLQAARQLFSEGYEHATTAAIARRAGSSESQIVKHFGGKEGLLLEIVDVWWESVLRDVRAEVSKKLPPLDALGRVFQIAGDAFRADDGLARVMMFEGRRIRRGSGEMSLSNGFRSFGQVLESLLDEAERQGLLADGYPPQIARDILLGAGEGLVRARLLASKSRYQADYEANEGRSAFRVLLGSLVLEAPPSPPDSTEN